MNCSWKAHNILTGVQGTPKSSHSLLQGYSGSNSYSSSHCDLGVFRVQTSFTTLSKKDKSGSLLRVKYFILIYLCRLHYICYHLTGECCNFTLTRHLIWIQIVWVAYFSFANLTGVHFTYSKAQGSLTRRTFAPCALVRWQICKMHFTWNTHVLNLAIFIHSCYKQHTYSTMIGK